MVNASQAGPVVPLEVLPLRTEGRWILDSRDHRFRLKCVNWYGASGELHVVHGLHKRSMADIVSDVVAWGFNCVRLPFSLELFFTDPPVPAHALAADPLSSRGGLTGLEAYDEAVATITGAGLLVLVDNHSSESGWCCLADAEDGAWFTAHYPETRWIQALTAMARRYQSNPRVFGLELRNEVRDAGDTQVVWGSGSVLDGRTAADWPSAAERAGNAILAENPSLLILVTGLCYGQDLRGARDRPVQLSVPGRLVWTSHSYHWYQWWHTDGIVDMRMPAGGALLAAALLCCLAAAAILWRARREARAATTLRASFETSCGLAGFLGTVLLVFGVTRRAKGEAGACTDMGQREAEPFLISGAVLLAAALAGVVVSMLLRLRQWRRGSVAADKPVDAGGGAEDALPRARKRPPAHCLPLLIGLALLFGGFAGFFLSTSSYWLTAAELNRHWGFALEEGQPYTAPVFLGEFGTDKRSDFWRALVQYVGENELSFAYWPLNGQKWNHDEDRWVGEWYGLLAKDWTRVRHDWKLLDVIGYGSAGR